MFYGFADENSNSIAAWVLICLSDVRLWFEHERQVNNGKCGLASKGERQWV